MQCRMCTSRGVATFSKSTAFFEATKRKPLLRGYPMSFDDGVSDYSYARFEGYITVLCASSQEKQHTD